jgi:hypothetical protein
MSQLPPFTVVSFVQTNMLHDTGDDRVFFNIYLELDAQLYYCSVPFYKLLDYLGEHKPADAEYFNRLRSSIAGFGPKETLVLGLAEEEGYNVEKEVMEYIALEYSIDKLIPINKTEPGISKSALAQGFNEIEELAQEIKPFNLRDIAFKDEVMNLLNKKVLEIYPEIFNSRPEYITELKGLLIDHVLKFGGDINSLAWKAYKKP